MEIAALICNDKLNYESAFHAYSIFEYLRKKGNSVQIIDYKLLDKNSSFGEKKKNQMLYDFISSNTLLTVFRYTDFSQIEERPPLADNYFIVNGTENELDLMVKSGKRYAYGIKDISLSDLRRFKNEYEKISLVNKLEGAESVDRVLDPMFLLSKDDWIGLAKKSNININEDYVLVSGDKITKEMLDYSNLLAKKNDLKVYIASDNIKTISIGTKKIKNYTPEELVSLVNNAKEVVASSNDVINLSIILEKSLHIFNNENEQIKRMFEFELGDRIVSSSKEILEKKESYRQQKEIINEIKLQSYNFLKI